MASIDITTQSGAVGNGDLQLQNGAPMDATLRFVTDAVNTASPLKLSTSLVQTTSTLKITTNDNPYIDAEDGSGNNRFTVGRAPASQQVNVDFASNPTGSTTAVGAIRTYRDGTNLSEAMTFIEDGSVGIGTTAPVGLLDLYKAAAATRLAIRGDAGQNRLISYRTGAVQRFGLYVNNTAESGSNAGSNFAIRAYDDAGTLLSTPLFIERSTGNVGIGTTTPTSKLDIAGTLAVSSTVTVNGNSITVQPTTATTYALNITQNTGGYLRVGRDTSTGALYGDAYAAIVVSSGAYPMIFGTNDTERMRITSAGNVGIGTDTPLQLLHVSGGSARIQRNVSGATSFSDEQVTIYNLQAANVGNQATIGFHLDSTSWGSDFTAARISAVTTNAASGTTDLAFGVSVDGSIAVAPERFRITPNGVTFNGDTAAANALDDYEEGTWTMGITFGGASVGMTFLNNTGNYTKIGRQVNVTGWVRLSSKGSSTGTAKITGLPFTNGAASQFYTAVTFGYIDFISFADVLNGYVETNATTIYMMQAANAGTLSDLTDANFANNSSVMINATYYV